MLRPQNWMEKTNSPSSSVARSIVASRREVRHFLLTMSDSLSDTGIANCNRRFWLQNVELEARKFWSFGKEIGVDFMGNHDEMVEKLIEMEKRDHNGIEEGDP